MNSRVDRGSVVSALGLLIFLFGSQATFAQLPTATILGVVKDGSGAVVPGASLTARNVNTGQSRATVTDQDGSYRLPALPVGSYEIHVEHPGFQSETRSGLTLVVGQEAVLNFVLEVGAIEQTVDVTADAPLVNTTSGSLGGLVDERKVAELPLNGRNYIDLSLLQPGVQQHQNFNPTSVIRGTFLSSNGAPLRSNSYLLDGASMVNAYGAASASITGSTLGVEGIREYRVVTNSFGAEYGMTMGSQMMIVSKGGTNRFQGSLFEYLRNSALDARNFFDYQTAVAPQRLPPFKRNNFGGSFGGPIKKDSIFFHAVYEGVRERLGLTIVDDVIPVSAKTSSEIAPVIRPLLALFPDPNLPNNRFTFPANRATSENYGQTRVDHNFSSSDTAFVRYTISDADNTRPLDYPQFRSIGVSRSQFLTLSENHVFSPSLLNLFRFSYSRTLLNADSASGISGPEYSFMPGREIGRLTISGVTQFGPDAGAPTGSVQNLFTWSDDLFYTRGEHSLKFGALINRYQMYMKSSLQANGTITFPDIQTFLQGRPSSYTAGTPGSVFDRTYQFSTFGFYIQDDLRVRPNLTLNLGLRYEFTRQPQEVRGHGAALRDIQHDAEPTLGPPIQNSSLRNFSPRFGFAWDVRGDSKTAVRGGFGLLYDIASLGSALHQGISGTAPFSTQSTVTSTPANPLTVVLPLFFPPGTAGRGLRGPDFLMQQPHLLQYNLTGERQLPFDMVATLAYGGSRGINLVQVKEGNPTVPQILPDGRQFWTGTELRTNPFWNEMTLMTAGANSWYNSLQFGLTKRLSRGLQFQSSYTWSKLIDETQGQLPADNNLGSGAYGADPTHREVDRGLAQFDLAHNWRLNAIYRLPDLISARSLGKILNGWWMSGILSLQNGYPFTVVLGSNRSRARVNGGAANIDRPDLVAGRSFDEIVLGGPNRYYDPSAFAIPFQNVRAPIGGGILGTAGRNILRGPGLVTLDFSLAKDTTLGLLGENGKLEFRAEFFNLLNRVNFALPNRVVYAARVDVEAPLANAGRINSAGTSRQIQFALKLSF